MTEEIKFIGYDHPDFELVKRIRTEVFTNEQGADANGEFDCYDSTAQFALFFENGNAVGTARIADTEQGVKIGRIAIVKACRGKGYGTVIVKAVTQKAFEQGARRVLVDAQNYAVPFYEKLGFTVIGAEIKDRGLPHIPMCISKEIFYGEKQK